MKNVLKNDVVSVKELKEVFRDTVREMSKTAGRYREYYDYVNDEWYDLYEVYSKNIDDNDKKYYDFKYDKFYTKKELDEKYITQYLL